MKNDTYIPRIIHFVWVGTQTKPDLVLKCIETWKKFCPDYQIMEWGNESLKDIKNLYVSQAYENKKWAFVSDYLRLYALEKYGGFYCDSDLEITNPLEEFRRLRFVTGYEKYNNVYSPITALMGAEPHNQIIHDLLEEYAQIPFIQNGLMDQTTNVTRISKYFEKKFGLKKPYDGSMLTRLDENSMIYPSYYFCTPEDGKKNFSIHHFSGSWLDAYSRKNLCTFGKFKIARFKKRRKSAGNIIPLMANETKLLSFSLGIRKKICLIREN